MRILKLLLLVLLGGFSFSLSAQILNIDPVFPTVDDTITVLYDATQGNGALAGVSPVYAHAGLITDQSTTPTDWKYVQGNWGTADPNTLMEDLGNNIHKLRYHIRSYYGVPANETVEELAFVFRNQDGSVVGRDTDGSDIYYPVYQAGDLAVRILEPTNQTIFEIGDTLKVSGASSDSSTLSLYIDDGTSMLVSQTTGKSITYSTVLDSVGLYSLILWADNGTLIRMDTVDFAVRPSVNIQDPPAGIKPGINYINDSTVVLGLYAPGKEFALVWGDFSDWNIEPNLFMDLSVDSTLWWTEITGLTPGEEYAYQYLVPVELGLLFFADPYAEKILDPGHDPFIPASVYPDLKPYPFGETTRIVSVLQTAQTPYNWQSNDYERPDKENLIVYELLVRDFVETHAYKTVIDSLDYLQRLGVNAIELMPIMEFEGNISWGYNPSFLFAVDKYYGTANDLKALIDSCHQRGIAVILDMVLNHHFGQSPLVELYWDGVNNRPAADNPWFNPVPKHPFNVGYDMNHESPQTQEYVDRVLRYWTEEFRFDGYRFDLSKGFTQTDYGNDVGAWSGYDAGRIALLKRMADELWSVDSSSYVILEHFSDNAEEKELANYGMMFWGNMVHNYNEATMGYLPQSNFDWISYQNRGWNDPHVIGYMESHDEERLMFKNKEFGNASGNHNTKDLVTALGRMEAAAALFIPVPGPKMIWQFGELGYDVSIDFNGRTGEKPIRWEYLENPYRYRLYTIYAALNELKTTYPVFQTDDFTLDANGAVKHLNLNDPSMNVTIFANFDVTFQTGVPEFQHTGWWYDYLTGDSIEVTSTSASVGLEPGEYHIYTDVKIAQPTVTVDIEADLEPTALGLRAFPNPFGPELYIQFELPEKDPYSLEILNSMGQRVRLLAGGGLPVSGRQELRWDGTNAQGQTLPAGLYFVRLQTENHQEIKQVLLRK
jgi:hypothetical protein